MLKPEKSGDGLGGGSDEGAGSTVLTLLRNFSKEVDGLVGRCGGCFDGDGLGLGGCFDGEAMCGLRRAIFEANAL